MGALGGTRTPNLLIRSQMLYPLSYERQMATLVYDTHDGRWPGCLRGNLLRIGQPHSWSTTWPQAVVGSAMSDTPRTFRTTRGSRVSLDLR